MDILIVSHFGSTYSKSDNDRFLYLAKELSKENNVEIVTSSFCHEKKEHRFKTEAEWPFKVTFIDEPGYRKNICLKRFYSHFKFGLNLNKYIKNRKKPDIIYCAIPSLTGPWLISKYCRAKKVKFIIDIQDLWPEAFQMVFNIPLISPIIFYPFNVLANTVYRNADEIIGVSETYVNRALEISNNCDKGYAVFLGTDLENFDKNINNGINIKKNDKDVWLGYCGTLGSSYDLTCVFDALKEIENRGKIPPKFIVMGDGPLLTKFKEYARKLDVDAVFIGRIPYNKMCSYIAACDIAVNPIMHGAAQSIINKHADYVASGIPIVSTQESEEFRKLIDEYQMGINCRNENIKELADAIIFLMENPEDCVNMGKNARRCAEEKFDRKNIYREIIAIILKQNCGKGRNKR